MITELRDQYTKTIGKKPFNGWDEEKLKELIEKHTGLKETVDPEEAERIADAKRINSMQHKILPDQLTPVWLNGEPHAIIDNKYVPWVEAEIYFEEKKIEEAQAKLKELKSNL